MDVLSEVCDVCASDPVGAADAVVPPWMAKRLIVSVSTAPPEDLEQTAILSEREQAMPTVNCPSGSAYVSTASLGPSTNVTI